MTTKNIEVPENAKFVLEDGIGYVALLNHMGDDTTVVNAARCSYGKQVTEIDDRDKILLKYLAEHEHDSPREHCVVSFLVKCPLPIARQWMRHRLASYSEISRRYSGDNIEFYVPKVWREQSEDNKQGSSDDKFVSRIFAPEGWGYEQRCELEERESQIECGFMPNANALFEIDELVRKHNQSSLNLYNALTEANVARELARGVLPVSMYTQFQYTGNLRSLLHFIELRGKSDAQYEIRVYADAMFHIVRELYPETVAAWQRHKGYHMPNAETIAAIEEVERGLQPGDVVRYTKEELFESWRSEFGHGDNKEVERETTSLKKEWEGREEMLKDWKEEGKDTEQVREPVNEGVFEAWRKQFGTGVSYKDISDKEYEEYQEWTDQGNMFGAYKKKQSMKNIGGTK